MALYRRELQVQFFADLRIGKSAVNILKYDGFHHRQMFFCRFFCGTTDPRFSSGAPEYDFHVVFFWHAKYIPVIVFFLPVPAARGVFAQPVNVFLQYFLALFFIHRVKSDIAGFTGNHKGFDRFTKCLTVQAFIPENNSLLK